MKIFGILLVTLLSLSAQAILTVKLEGKEYNVTSISLLSDKMHVNLMLDASPPIYLGVSTETAADAYSLIGMLNPALAEKNLYVTVVPSSVTKLYGGSALAPSVLVFVSPIK